jgi:hypothetical protein
MKMKSHFRTFHGSSNKSIIFLCFSCNHKIVICPRIALFIRPWKWKWIYKILRLFFSYFCECWKLVDFVEAGGNLRGIFTHSLMIGDEDLTVISILHETFLLSMMIHWQMNFFTLKIATKFETWSECFLLSFFILIFLII